MLDIVLTNRASNSLDDIVDFYLENYTPERTEKVILSIEDTFIRIAKSPKSFAICFDITSPKENIRQAIVHNTFKIIYRIQPNTIEIIEIFHGTRNPKLLADIL